MNALYFRCFRIDPLLRWRGIADVLEAQPEAWDWALGNIERLGSKCLEFGCQFERPWFGISAFKHRYLNVPLDLSVKKHQIRS
jgi:hypothetical protein